MSAVAADANFDAIVLGAGQAGPPLAVALAQAGQRVALFERKDFGGTCVNTGCIPTKTLVATARVAHVVRHAADFGLRQRPLGIDMTKVKARKDAVSGESRAGVEKWLRDTPGCTVLTGHARFIGDHEIELDGRRLAAPRVFINVGGRAAVPDLPGLADVDYLTNSSMLALDVLPRHLVVLGGSYIGIEFAQMYRRFGSRVTILQRGPRLLSREDAHVADAMHALLVDDGIDVHLDVDNIAVAPARSGVSLRFTAGGKRHRLGGSHLLVATGRRPNTDDLGLQNTTIRTDAHGYITVDDTLATTAPGVWALGDCNGRGAFTHTSYNDYEIVAANLLHDEGRRLLDRIPTYAVYTDPPLARVGMNLGDIRRAGIEALVGHRDMSRVGRARERGETRGFLEAYVEASSNRILGACFFGIEADEAIHVITDTMYARQPYTTLTHAVHIHPTVSELIPTVLEDLKPLGAG